MTLPQHKNPVSNREALAPYNFVPLPEKVLSGEVSDLDAYHAGQHTGWFECVLTTETPLYVRCGLLPHEDDKDKDRPDFFTDPLTHQPVIPGSSLRGMLRALVEIVSYSKVQPVTNELKVTFRAVAAKSDDPLAQPYKDTLKSVKVGYLHKRGDIWFVQPATRPASISLPEQGAYLKVKDRSDLMVPDLIRFKRDDYRPQYHLVRFDCESAQDKRGKKYARVVNVGGKDSTGKYTGVLICSGNMAESGKASSSRRKSYALVLEQDLKAPPVSIPKQVVQDYLDALTDFQTETPFDSRYGCLIEGRPVFYLEANKQVVAFGHTPNFRIPAWFVKDGERRAATPLDFVPEALRNQAITDLAEALFGYVGEKSDPRDVVARAGRVCVTDARLNDGQSDIWVSDAPITPKILGGPKPTTFQHYLVQEYPNDKKSLRHYASSTPDETVIRGHKLYWHKRNLQRSDWEETPDKIKPGGDTQHTKIKPVREGVSFHFRVYFEDLSDRELGALAWLLKLAAADGYRFKLGMGKPLGLGSIKVTTTLRLTQRPERYSHLFIAGSWATGESDSEAVATQAQTAFEQWILNEPELNPRKAERLEDVDRIKMLLFLLQWPGPDKEKTRYFEIERGAAKENEYKERPVLPTPEGVVNPGKSSSTSPASSSGRPSAKPQQAPPASRKPQAPATAKPQAPAVSTPAPPAKSQTVVHPQTVEEIKVGDLLEGKVIAVDATSVKFDLGVGATGSMGLVRLDSLVRSHPYFRDKYRGIPKPTASMLYTEGELGEDLYGTRMQVRVLKIEQRQDKTLVKLDFEKWLD